MKKETLEFIENWSKELKIDGQCFDDLFQIEGIPLWWFIKKNMYKQLLPARISLFALLEKNEKVSFLQNLKYKMNVKAMRLYLSKNEQKKISVAPKITHKKNTTNKERILLLSFTNHISDDNAIFRLDKTIKKIQEDGTYGPLVLFADALSRRSYKKISELSTIYSYCDAGVVSNAKSKARKMYQRWQNIDSKTKKSLMYYDNKNYFPYFQYALDFFLSEEFMIILFMYYETFKKIIQYENVRTLVITGLTSTFERCLLAAGGHYKKPTVYISHGIAKETITSDLIYDTKIAMISDYYKNEYIELGVDPKQIHVVGPVIFDEVVNFKTEKKSQLNNILIGPGAKVSGDKLTKDQYFQNFERLIQDIKSLGDIEINIKPHPRSVSENDFMKIISKYKNVHFHKPNVSRKHFYQLMQDSDIYIHFGSNSAMEAMIIGRPIMTIDQLYDGKPFPHWLQGKKFIMETNFNEDIKKVILETIQNQDFLKLEQEKIIAERLGNVDGKAYERVVDLIYMA